MTPKTQAAIEELMVLTPQQWREAIAQLGRENPDGLRRLRIQRQRTKGWRRPKGAVYVGRPSRWGNPYTPANYFIVDISGRGPQWPSRPASLAECAEAYRRDLTCDDDRCKRDEHPWTEDLDPRELAGADLICWCPLDQPCHADVLLHLANREAVPDAT